MWNLIPVENWNSVYFFTVPDLKTSASDTAAIKYYVVVTVKKYGELFMKFGSNRPQIQDRRFVTNTDWITAYVNVLFFNC